LAEIMAVTVGDEAHKNTRRAAAPHRAAPTVGPLRSLATVTVTDEGRRRGRGRTCGDEDDG
jgi:hypothetical protein